MNTTSNDRTFRSIAEEGIEAVLSDDFYRCPNTGEWVYKWVDERLVLRDSDGVPIEGEGKADGALPLQFGAEAISFISSLLTTPGIELLPNEQERFGALIEEFLEARDGANSDRNEG